MGQRHLFLILLLGAGTLPFTTSAQADGPISQHESSCVEHELGVNLVSWINSGIPLHSGDVCYVNGLLYKLHWRQNALRLGVEVFRDSYVIGTSAEDGGISSPFTPYQEGSSVDQRYRLGYQRSFGTCKLRPFAGADVGFRHFRDRYDYEWGGHGFIYNPTKGSAVVTTQVLFIAPLVGLNYRPTAHWSFTVEASFSWSKGSSTNERTERSFLFPEERTYSYSKEVTGMLLDPLRTVSLNYHF